ncbi:MAG: thioredoxin family protein [Armatimonadetes bacterium]|nr:thioredoxin family protein [Armatimonadota bacterium]
MTDTAGYLDLNQDLYRAHFERALAYDAYVATADPKHLPRWEQALGAARLTEAQAELLAGFTRKLYVLVLSGTWCGDCIRECPLYHLIAQAAPSVDLRFLDRDENPELTDLLRVAGAKKVPVAVFLSEDFFEVGRFGDRTLSIYRAKAERELGAACATGIVPPEQAALAVELQEWVDIFEWMHLILRTAPLLRRRYGD